MNRIALIAGCTLALGLSSVVEARHSTAVELRGYDLCMEAADEDSNGLVPARSYLVDTNDGVARYYVNATRWEDGDRAAVRIACETAQRGRELVSATIENGRYVNEREARITVEVAQK